MCKGKDPYGRIVHDYGYYKKGSYSVNAAHADTSVVYMRTKERIQLLENFTYLVYKGRLGQWLSPVWNSPKGLDLPGVL